MADPPAPGKRVMVVDAAVFDKFKHLAATHGCDEIRITTNDPAFVLALEIDAMPNAQGLVAFTPGTDKQRVQTDWSQLRCLSSLTHLTIRRYEPPCDIDYSTLTNLKFLALSAEKANTSWTRSAQLKSLILSGYDGSDLSALSGLSGLESLCLTMPKVRSLEGINTLRSLRVFCIKFAKQLEDTGALRANRTIEELLVEACPRGLDWQSVGGMSQLTAFSIDRIANIDFAMSLSRRALFAVWKGLESNQRATYKKIEKVILSNNRLEDKAYFSLEV